MILFTAERNWSILSVCVDSGGVGGGTILPVVISLFVFLFCLFICVPVSLPLGAIGWYMICARDIP